MFGWKKLGPKFRTEQAYQVMGVLEQAHIRYKMPADDMFFVSGFHLPNPDLRWHILVKRRDHGKAMKLLREEGLAGGTETDATVGRPANAGLPACPKAK